MARRLVAETSAAVARSAQAVEELELELAPLPTTSPRAQTRPGPRLNPRIWELARAVRVDLRAPSRVEEPRSTALPWPLKVGGRELDIG